MRIIKKLFFIFFLILIPFSSFAFSADNVSRSKIRVSTGIIKSITINEDSIVRVDFYKQPNRFLDLKIESEDKNVSEISPKNQAMLDLLLSAFQNKQKVTITWRKISDERIILSLKVEK